MVSFLRGESRGSQGLRHFLQHGPKPGCGLSPGVMSLSLLSSDRAGTKSPVPSVQGRLPPLSSQESRSGSSPKSWGWRGTQCSASPAAAFSLRLWGTFYYFKGMHTLPGEDTQRCSKLSQQLRQNESGSNP